MLTNDDGYDAKGIKALYEALSRRYTVTVVAPQTEQSGIGHAFSYKTPLSYHRIPDSFGMNGFAVSGTPADCVKFAVSHILDAKPDFVISGMNLGENTGISGHYSGTVAGAREGALWGVRSIAFSLAEESESHLSYYCSHAVLLLESVLSLSPGAFGSEQKRAFLNVNFPPCEPEACKGVRITRQSLAFFDDRYELIHSDDSSKQYWLRGTKTQLEESDEYDSRAVESGFIAITPLDCDSTAQRAIPYLTELKFTDSKESL